MSKRYITFVIFSIPILTFIFLFYVYINHKLLLLIHIFTALHDRRDKYKQLLDRRRTRAREGVEITKFMAQLAERREANVRYVKN